MCKLANFATSANSNWNEIDPGEQEQLSTRISRCKDIFATNLKHPKQNTLPMHKIITDNSMPVYQKPRHIPQAWEQEIDAKVCEMLDNRIIQPSESP